MLFIKYTKSL